MSSLLIGPFSCFLCLLFLGTTCWLFSVLPEHTLSVSSKCSSLLNGKSPGQSEPGTGQIEPLRLDWAQRQWLVTTHPQQCHLQNAHCPATLGITGTSVLSRVDGEEHPGSLWGYSHILARSRNNQQIVTGINMIIGINILLYLELHYVFQVNT